MLLLGVLCGLVYVQMQSRPAPRHFDVYDLGRFGSHLVRSEQPAGHNIHLYAGIAVFLGVCGALALARKRAELRLVAGISGALLILQLLIVVFSPPLRLRVSMLPLLLKLGHWLLFPLALGACAVLVLLRGRRQGTPTRIVDQAG